MIDDEKIIEMFFERSEQGIRELDRKYGAACRSLSCSIVNNRQDAEECVNDAYFGAWNAIPPARPNPLLSYLLKIVRNLSLKAYWRTEASKRGGRYMPYRSGGIYTSPFHWKRYPQHTTRCRRKCLRVYNGRKRCSLSSDFFLSTKDFRTDRRKCNRLDR